MNVKVVPNSVHPHRSLAKSLRSTQRFHQQLDRRSQWQSNLRLFRLFCSQLPQTMPNPIFVKVGANDGITGDPCSDILIADTRWRGLLIEPVPYCFARLRQNFSDSARFALEQVAVGPRAAQSTFYWVGEEARELCADLPNWFDQLGSFDRQHILKHLNGILEPFIIELQVEVLPLSEILQGNQIQDCHLLHIDAEGHDYQVLRTLDFSLTRPVAIFIEHKHLGDSERSELLGLLYAHRYLVRDCGGDYFAIDKKANKAFCHGDRIIRAYRRRSATTPQT
ncbi:MAG: FkbM family methyltransferase [Oscillatoriales cyanobacterium SM2_2_1]|nr:FkbM family methyltransferase [Oscillatoriales cyanobacterium SM2_2_1]